MTSADHGTRGPHIPSKPIILPEGRGLQKDSSTQDKLHFWGKGCRAKRAWDSWEQSLPRYPARPAAIEGSRWPLGGRAEARTEPRRQGRAKRRF